MSDAPDPEIVVYKRPGCGYCMALAVGLRRRGIHYRSVDIWKDDGAAAFVRQHAGGDETVPTVVIDGRVLVNPSARQVVAHLEAARGESTP
jgi:glutaredoxin-like protein